ncbi:hypothetical protein [Klebsiella pneumoniae]|uniref:hypothetical protein n=1 Tax=Klebsiella pneumoniae TaxID=573 RepID=UPI001ABA83FF
MKTRIHVVQGDVTKLAVDVIVNAANPSLMGELWRRRWGHSSRSGSTYWMPV